MLFLVTFALCRTPQLIRIPEHVVQRHLSDGSKLIVPYFTIDDCTTSCIKTTNDSVCARMMSYEAGEPLLKRTLEFSRRHNFDFHDGLKNGCLS